MRWRDLRSRRRSDLDIKMTPMIDVVFLLLIYFLWTASFQIAEFDLPANRVEMLGAEAVDLAEPPPPEADFEDIIVRVRGSAAQLSWTINDAPLFGLAEVRERLETIAQINAAATVILHPDTTVPLGDVIDVYDAARAAGFDSVNFAATPAG